MRLKRFALSLVDTEQNMTEKFVLGLDSKIRCTVGVHRLIDIWRSFENCQGPREAQSNVRLEKSVTIGRKRPFDSRDSVRRPPAHKPHYADRSDPRQVERHPPRRMDKHLKNQDGARWRRELGARSVGSCTEEDVWPGRDFFSMWPRGSYHHQLHDQKHRKPT